MFNNMMPFPRFYYNEVILSQFHFIPFHRNFHPTLKKVEIFMHGFVQVLDRPDSLRGHDSHLDRLRPVIENPGFFRFDFFLNFHVYVVVINELDTCAVPLHHGIMFTLMFLMTGVTINNLINKDQDMMYNWDCKKDKC